MDIEHQGAPAPEEERDGYKPKIPPIIRTVIYTAGLIWGFLATIAVGTVAVIWPEQATEILAIIGSISGGFSFLTGATGVAYRPTARP